MSTRVVSLNVSQSQLLVSPARVWYLSSASKLTVSVMWASASTHTHSVKHKPIFDTLVNDLKWRTLLALGQNRPTQSGFLLSVKGHGQRLGNIFYLVSWSWHDLLALDKIKDGPLKHFWWVIACMQSTRTADKDTNRGCMTESHSLQQPIALLCLYSLQRSHRGDGHHADDAARPLLEKMNGK